MLGASPQGVTRARLSYAKLALVAISLPPERLVTGVPGLKVGSRVVGQGVRGHLVGARLLSVLLGRPMLRAEGPRLVFHSYGVQREISLGSQLRQVPPFGIEVIIDLVSCTVGCVDRGEESRDRGEKRELGS